MDSVEEMLSHASPEDLARGRRANAPAKLAHFVLKTPRFDAMVHWYETVLDAQVVFRNERLAFLTYDLEHHRIAIANVPWPLGFVGAAARYLRKVHGLDHVAFTYATLAELVATYQRLTGLGIRPVWCINHGPTTSMYYEDPDGNRIELQYDNFATLADLAGFIRSGEFQRNPIGVEFDPDVLAERLEGGAPLEQLVQRGSASRPGVTPRSGYATLRWRTL